MAEAHSEYTHAVEKILEWYHSLRVDHLSSEELDFELKIRAIIIRDDPTYSRRRRSLRDHLKAEKEQQRSYLVEDVVNWEETLQYFKPYYDEISTGLLQNDKNLKVRGQAKLLHFGHRIILLLKQAEGEESNFLKTMLIDVVKLLKKYYYADPVVSGSGNRGEPFDDALINLFRTEGDSVPQSLPNLVTGTGVEAAGSGLQENIPMSPLLETLLTRIRDLTMELVDRDKKREEESQNRESEVPSVSQQPVASTQPTVQVTSRSESLCTSQAVHPQDSQTHSCSSVTTTPGPAGSVTFSLPQIYSTASPQFSSSWHSHLQRNSTTQPMGSTQTTNSLRGFPVLSSVPYVNPWQGVSAVNNAPISNPWLGSQAAGFTQASNPLLGNPTSSYTQASNPWLGNQASGFSQASAPWPGIQAPGFSQPAYPLTGTSTSYPYANPAFAPFNPVLTGNQGRHTLAVSKWTISKYDGEDQGLKLNHFLGMVHAMSVAEHVSEVELFESAIHLFKGPALQWYMTMRASGRLINWQHLVLELRRTFMHPDLDTLIKMKVYQRHQSRNETFLQYYHGMEELFGTMSVPLPEYEKVQILLQNLRIDYKKQLNFLPIADLPTLVSAGQKIDAVNFSVYNKVFGPEKSVNVVESFKADTAPKKDLSKNKNKESPRDQQFQPRNNSNANPPPQTHQNQNSPHTGTASRGPARPPTTLEEMIDAHQPPSSRHCFNCGKFGHRMDRCMLPKGVLCENCGFRGYPSNNCPYCIKNTLAASQNRRPLNPNF